MSIEEKAPAKTGAGKRIMSDATQIVAVRDRFVPDNAPIDIILAKLEGVRQRRQGQNSARCPAHADRGPSLSVRETPDGSVLLHCFAGCNVAAIVGAVGLGLADLFPPLAKSGREPRRTPRLLSAGQALELLSNEAAIVLMAGAGLVRGQPLSPVDRERVVQAVGRIGWMREESMGVRCHA